MNKKSYFIFYAVIALCLFGYYQHNNTEWQKRKDEATLHSQQLNNTMSRIIEKSNVVLRILEETQLDLEATSKDLEEVKGILKARNKNEE